MDRPGRDHGGPCRNVLVSIAEAGARSVDPHAPDSFVVAGEGAWIRAAAPKGAAEIRLHPVVAARDVRTGLPPPRQVQLVPGGFLRNLGMDGAELRESVVSFHRLPAVALRWELPEGSDDRELTVTWRVPEGEDPRVGEHALDVAVPEHESGLRFVWESERPRWSVGGEASPGSDGPGSEAGSLPVEVTVRLRPGRPATLLVTRSGRNGGPSLAESRLPRLDRELAAWASARRRDREEGLTVDPGEPGLRSAFLRATDVLDGAVAAARADPQGPLFTDLESPAERWEELPWVGLGLLAAGRFDDARRVVERSAEGLLEGRASGDLALAVHLHLLSRYVLWTGDPEPLDPLDALEEAPASHPPLEELADALEAAGDGTGASALRERRPGGHRSTARDRLEPAPASPDLGEGPDPLLVAAILGAPDGDTPEREGDGTGGLGNDAQSAGGAPPAPGSVLRPGLTAWARWARGNADGGLEPWREAVTGAGGTGDEPGSLLSAASGVAVAAPFFGLLSARGDAFYGRLELAPRIPGAWTELRIEGIRLGGSRMALEYSREGSRHAFLLAPLAGAVPLNLVFSPLLPVDAVASVRIDGEEAELDTYRRAGRVGVRMQLPLDGERRVTVAGAGGGGK